MNNFTKEELICIRDNLVVPEKNDEFIIIKEIYWKLVNMIDSYCDHELEVYPSGSTGIPFCNICNRAIMK